VPAAPVARGLARSLLLTFVGSGLTLALNLITGVLTARLLGTEGRGELAAISSLALTLSWAGALGFPEALTFLQSKWPAQSDRIVGTALLGIVPLGVGTVLIGEALLPLAFSAQSAPTLAHGRLFLLVLPAYIGLNCVWALLSGHQRFGVLTASRVAQPLLFAGTLGAMWVGHVITVPGVLMALAGSYLLSFAAFGGWLPWSVGLGRPSLSVAHTGLNYGLRMQGQTLGALGNARLDLTLLPAFVAARQLGYYAIAVSVASMVVVLFGQLQLVVFPVVARSTDSRGPALLGSSLRLVLLASSVVAIVLAALAPWLVPLVYGSAFAPAVRPLWLLLPGIVFWTATSIVASGLQAANKPGRASAAQLVGFAVTVIGLLLTLPRFGILGAALTSSVSYTLTFWIALWLLHRHTGFPVRETFRLRPLRSDAQWLSGRLRQVRRR
jgi:antigen flippase